MFWIPKNGGKQISHKKVNISETDTDRYMTLIHEICLEFDVEYKNEKNIQGIPSRLIRCTYIFLFLLFLIKKGFFRLPVVIIQLG